MRTSSHALLVSLLAAPALSQTLIRDIHPTSGSGPTGFAASGRLLLFAADDGVHGVEPWVTDGTAAGTKLLADLEPGAAGSTPGAFTALGEKVVFIAATLARGAELYVTQGTAATTSLLLDVNPGAPGSDPFGFTLAGDRIFFTATTASAGRELWLTNGVPAGTAQVVDLWPGSGDGATRWQNTIVPHGRGVLFAGLTPATGMELFRSEGTAAGTSLVAEIWPGTTGSFCWGMTRLGAAILFNASDGRSGSELWRTDGTASGTWLVKDIHAGASSAEPREFVALGNTVFFSAYTATYGREVYRTDGSAAGTALLADIWPGSAGSVGNLLGSYRLSVAGDRLFFPAQDGVHGIEPWISDGSSQGTHLITDLRAGSLGSVAASALFVAAGAGRRGLFSADDGTHGIEPWVSDGTAAGTTLLVDIRPGVGSSAADEFMPVALAGSYLFAADDGLTGRELHGLLAAQVGASLVEPFRSGCAGTGGRVPRITSGVPSLGNTAFTLGLSEALPAAPALLLGAASPASIPLGGCVLLVDLGGPALGFATAVDGAGTAGVGLPLPGQAALLGTVLWWQYVVRDPGGAWGSTFAFSGGLRTQIGR